jgi:hypothetical protein
VAYLDEYAMNNLDAMLLLERSALSMDIECIQSTRGGNRMMDARKQEVSLLPGDNNVGR